MKIGSRRTVRWGAFVAASALAVTGLATVAAPAQAAPDLRPVTTGGDWLAGQLTNGLVHNPNFGGFDDYGLTADVAFALEAVGGHGATLTEMGNALAPVVDQWYDYFGTRYTGSLAKAAVFADAVGQDPTAFGGIDLIDTLEDQVATAAPIAGRIENQNETSFPAGLPIDSANTLGQAYAVAALSKAGSAKAGDALSFLLKQQCNAGFFRLNLTEDKAAADQTCEGGRGSGASAPDPDATSLAVLQMLPLLSSSPAAARAIGRAEAWLLGQQRSDGSFAGGTSTDQPNSNSTGLAGWALGTLGDLKAATRAAAWVRGRQADEPAGCANALNPSTGAIGYNDESVANGLVDGITDTVADQWRRASSQALVVLQWAPQATPAVAVTAPQNYLRAGTTQSIKVSGVVPGEKVCLTGLGAPVRAAADADGDVLLKAVLPSGTANRTVTVTDRTAHSASDVVKVLGTKVLGVKAYRKVVKRGKSVTVRVSGLAAGERALVRFRGRTVARGSANSAGVFVAKFSVRRKLGAGRVVAWGQFASLPRAGKTVVRVVR